MSETTSQGVVIKIKGRIHGPYERVAGSPGEAYFCSFLTIETSSGDSFSIDHPTPESLIYFCNMHSIDIDDQRKEKPVEL